MLLKGPTRGVVARRYDEGSTRCMCFARVHLHPCLGPKHAHDGQAVQEVGNGTWPLPLARMLPVGGATGEPLLRGRTGLDPLYVLRAPMTPYLIRPRRGCVHVVQATCTRPLDLWWQGWSSSSRWMLWRS